MTAIDLSKNDWGGSIKIAGREVSIRQALGTAGVCIWLAVMLTRTGSAGLTSLVTTAQFLLTLLVITSATRSISLRTLLSVFLAGGFVMGIIAIVGKVMGFASGGLPAKAAVAIFEEAAILLPAFAFIWRCRKGRIWSFGATDVFLLFAFCGAGFAMVETAYILQARGLDQLAWFPVVAWDGDRIRGYHLFNGHELWASVVGLGLGLSLLARHKGIVMWSIPAAAVAIGVLDHFALDARGEGFLVNIASFISMDGYMTLILFVVGLAASVTADARVIYRELPEYLWVLMKRPLWSPSGYSSLLNLRALAFANHQLLNAKLQDKPDLATVCLSVTERLDPSL